MSNEKPQWGTAEWFGALYTEEGAGSPTAYFSYDTNGYQRFRHRRLIRVLESAEELIGEQPRLLDLGCATGVLTSRIGETVGTSDMTGVDFSPDLLESGRENFPTIRFVHAGLPAIPLEDGCADLLSLIEVLYYVPPEQRFAAVLECARLLRPGGMLFFAGNIQGEPYLTREEVEELLAGTGFVVERRYLEHYRLAVRMERQLLRLNRLCGQVLSDEPPGLGQGSTAALAARLRNLPGRLFARLAAAVARMLVGSLGMVSALVRLNQLLPIGAPTHIILLARKC